MSGPFLCDFLSNKTTLYCSPFIIPSPLCCLLNIIHGLLKHSFPCQPQYDNPRRSHACLIIAFPMTFNPPKTDYINPFTLSSLYSLFVQSVLWKLHVLIFNNDNWVRAKPVKPHSWHGEGSNTYCKSLRSCTVLLPPCHAFILLGLWATWPQKWFDIQTELQKHLCQVSALVG